MAGFTVHLKGLEPFLRTLDQYPNAVQRVVEDALEDMALRAQAEVVRRTPSGMAGHLRQGIHAGLVRGRGAFSYVSVEGPGASYWGPVEYGRKSTRMPPQKPIRDWVRRVLHPGVEVEKGRFKRVESVDATERRIKSIAYAISLVIAGRRPGGPKSRSRSGHHMFRDGYEASKQYVRQVSDRAAKRATELLKKGATT